MSDTLSTTLADVPAAMYLRNGHDPTPAATWHLDLHCESIEGITEKMYSVATNDEQYQAAALQLFPAVATDGRHSLLFGSRRVCRVCALGPISALLLTPTASGPREKVAIAAGTPHHAFTRQLRHGRTARRSERKHPSERAQDRHRDLAAAIGAPVVETGSLAGPIIVADVEGDAIRFVVANYEYNIVPPDVTPTADVVTAAWHLLSENPGPPTGSGQGTGLETWWHVAALACS